MKQKYLNRMEYWTNLNSLLASPDYAADYAADYADGRAEPLAQLAARLAARLKDEGVTLAVWTFAPEQLPVARQLSANGLDIALLVPNLPAYVRDVTGAGPIKAMVSRFRQLPAKAKVLLPIRNLKDALSIVRQDFGMGLSILAEMEVERCRRLHLRRAVISASAIDLAVALNNRRVVVRLIELLRRRFHLSPSIETANLGLTASKFVEWGIDTSELSYLSPLNKVGYGMRPNQALCEEVCRSGRVTVVGNDIDADGELPPDEALSYVQSLGVTTCMIPPSILLKEGVTNAESEQQRLSAVL